MNDSVPSLVSCWSDTGLDIIHESYRGLLKYSNPTVSAELENGTTVVPDTKEDLCITIEYEVILKGTGRSIRRPLKKPVKILLNPIVTQRYRYFPNLDGREEYIFPPSTNRFYSRLFVLDIETYYDDDGSVGARCSLHQCLGQDRLWLTISNSETGEIYEAFLIHHYEGNIFLMPNDAQLDFALAKRYADGVHKSDLFDVEGFLKGPPPSMAQLAKLVQDVNVPNLMIHNTLERTISQLVPQVFPENIRQSLCVFLGLLALDKIEQRKDPDDLSVEFAPWRMVSSLYNSHLLYTILKIEPPSYVRLMHLAARKEMQGIGRTVREDIGKSEWLMFWHLLHDGVKNFRDEMPILLDIVERSNQLGTITGKIIPSRSAGQRSRKAWVTRLVCNSSVTSPSLICTPNLEALGLEQILYLGSAYCWPHTHMSYITSLGRWRVNNPLHLQHMILPSKASERVRRLIPSVLNVTWSSRVFNPDLYTDGWNVRSEDILSSLGRTRPLTTLRKKYHTPSPCDVNHITPTEALVMDIITRSFHMMYFKERPYLFEKMFGIEKHLFTHTARSLAKRGVLEPQYILIPPLPTLATIAYGEPKNIISLADAFLSESPTCTAYICNEGKDAVFLSRIPPSELGELATSLPQAGQENGTTIRCFRPHTLRSYNHSLYQRLLREDGTWDDDVSGFFSQARGKRVEIASVIEDMRMRSCIT
ncbi:MAG: hypothetical protein ACTSWA_04115 [Candidatus Thorarchaeota archaeon]